MFYFKSAAATKFIHLKKLGFFTSALWSGFGGMQQENGNFGLCWKGKVGQVVTHMAQMLSSNQLISLLQTSPDIPPKLSATLCFLKSLKIS